MKTEILTKEVLATMKKMVLVFIYLKMVEDTKVNGKMIREMEKVQDISFNCEIIVFCKTLKLNLITKGILTWPNGDIYEGEYKDDNRNGFGIYKYSNGNRYEGEFKNDKQHGKGKITFKIN